MSQPQHTDVSTRAAGDEVNVPDELVLVVITWWPRDPAAHRTRPLLSLERDEITAIEIARRPPQGDPIPVQLAREGDHWLVRSSAGYPASDANVEKLLDQLLSIEVSGPVGTQPSSHEAFKVSDEGYGRRVDVTAGEEHLSLLFGASGLPELAKLKPTWSSSHL